MARRGFAIYLTDGYYHDIDENIIRLAIILTCRCTVDEGTNRRINFGRMFPRPYEKKAVNEKRQPVYAYSTVHSVDHIRPPFHRKSISSGPSMAHGGLCEADWELSEYSYSPFGRAIPTGEAFEWKPFLKIDCRVYYRGCRMHDYDQDGRRSRKQDSKH